MTVILIIASSVTVYYDYYYCYMYECVV